MMGWTEATGKPFSRARSNTPSAPHREAARHSPADVITRCTTKDCSSPPSRIGEARKAPRRSGNRHRHLPRDEGGGHTGEIGSLVLWPGHRRDRADASASRRGVGTGSSDRSAARHGSPGSVGRDPMAHRRGGDTAPGRSRATWRPRAQTRCVALVHGKACRCCETTGPTLGTATNPDRFRCQCRCSSHRAVGAARRYPTVEGHAFNRVARSSGGDQVRKARDVCFGSSRSTRKRLTV